MPRSIAECKLLPYKDRHSSHKTDERGIKVNIMAKSNYENPEKKRKESTEFSPKNIEKCVRSNAINNPSPPLSEALAAVENMPKTTIH